MRAARLHSRSGFTLIELMVVLLLIAIMAMTAAPNLLTVLTMTEHENEARHLMGYGRAAMAHAVMKREAIVVHVDMNAQEYWITVADTREVTEDGNERPRGVNLSSYGQRPLDEQEYDQREDEEDQDWMPQDKADLAQAVAEINNAARREELGEEEEGDDELRFEDEDEQRQVLEHQQDSMEEGFSMMTQNTLFAQAKRIKHDHDGFETWEDREEARELRLEEIEKDMDQEAILQADEPLEDPLLKRHTLIETVQIQAVIIGDDEYVFQEKEFEKNVIEIELSPLGLDMPVGIQLLNEENEILQVIWDPMTGNAWFTAVEVES